MTIDGDVLAVARAMADRTGSRVGRALSEPAPRGLRAAVIEIRDDGLPVFAVGPDAEPITNEDVNAALADWP